MKRACSGYLFLLLLLGMYCVNAQEQPSEGTVVNEPSPPEPAQQLSTIEVVPDAAPAPSPLKELEPQDASPTAGESTPAPSNVQGKRPTPEELAEKLPKNAILINPVAPLLGVIFGIYTANIEYQRAFSSLMGLSVNAGFSYLKSGSVEGWGGQVEFGPRFSVFYRNVLSLYILPYLAYGYLAVTDNDGSYYDGYLMAGGLLCGYNWYKSGFMLGLGGGVEGYGILVGDLKEVFDLFPLRFRLILNIGYSW